MSSDIANIIAGPCLCKYKGKTFYSKSDVKLDFGFETFTADSDAYGPGTPRRKITSIKAAFTPVGVWDALSVLWPYPAFIFGSFITPVKAVESFDATANTATITAHGWRDSGPIRLSNKGGAVPTGLVVGTLYYVHVVDANTLTFHTSEAAALAGTGAIDITTAGTGETKIVEQEPLVIWGFDGKQLTLPVAAVSKMPDLSLLSTETPIGEVEFEGFKQNAIPITTTGSLFSLNTAALVDTGYDDANIITQPYAGAWGASPFDAFDTKAGFKLTFPMSLDAVGDDSWSVATRKLTSVGAEVRAQPTGVSLAELFARLALEGASAVPGSRMTGTDMNITGTGVYVRVYGAALINGGAIWSSKNDRMPELQWKASRTFTAGLPNPLFFIGTAAPV